MYDKVYIIVKLLLLLLIIEFGREKIIGNNTLLEYNFGWNLR